MSYIFEIENLENYWDLPVSAVGSFHGGHFPSVCFVLSNVQKFKMWIENFAQKFHRKSRAGRILYCKICRIFSTKIDNTDSVWMECEWKNKDINCETLTTAPNVHRIFCWVCKKEKWLKWNFSNAKRYLKSFGWLIRAAKKILINKEQILQAFPRLVLCFICVFLFTFRISGCFCRHLNVFTFTQNRIMWWHNAIRSVWNGSVRKQ